MIVIVFELLAIWISLNHASMQWTQLENLEAVCNDYSRAGFFIEKSNGIQNKWIIFLESGGLCYSAGTCNERFFRSDIRAEFATNREDRFFEFNPEFNLTETWNTLKSENRPLSKRINPYMSSMSTFIRDDANLTSVEGTDILDDSPTQNPVFYGFNRVVVPYCSSDIWLAEDDFVPRGVDLASDDPQLQFLDNVYSPDSETLQFTFRGRTIFKSVITQLLKYHKLSDATEILLAGSSAGGLGVVNNAKWVMDELANHTDSLITPNISVLVDSSWFINFRGNIFRRFDGTRRQSRSDGANSSSRNNQRLFDLIDSIPQCAELTSSGSPCCISLECVIMDERYFPMGKIPLMVVFSLYDVFLLADAISQQTPPLGNSNDNLPSLGVQFILTIAEYGGAMNTSLANSVPQVNQYSFAATQCLQHIYLATSTLWGSGGIYGESSREQISASLGEFSGSFKHVIRSERWTKYAFNTSNYNKNVSLESCDKSQINTMQDAINMWYTCRYSMSFDFRDSCNSIHCHEFCPEEISFLENDDNSYPDWSIILIVCIVLFITVMSILAKIAFQLWRIVLFRNQDQYLEDVENDEGNDLIDGIPSFPICGLEDAISIACLDLKYSIKFHKKKIKDEKEDSTGVSFAIAHHIEEEQKDAFARAGSTRRSSKYRSTWRHSRKTLKTGAKNSHDHVPKEQNVLNSNNSRIMSQCEPESVEEDKSSCIPYQKQVKEILKGVSVYFNPGELVGIMGPSGSGKTTFLDLLTGRRTTGQIKGTIFINGIPLEQVQDEYMSFTGYVLQLATPYYEELTVRENITLAAVIKLPRIMKWREKFERIEQIIDVTGLTNVADSKVGGLSGPGLSGGQKKRLTIALQLITMPKVIFLDEPTSGLDATSSVELLSHLNKLAETNRTIILTIHQPRLEIFHMFHKLILLSDGLIAYHGVPQNAYGFFVEAAVSSFWDKKLNVPEIGDHNPADLIMDMLGKPVFRRAILHHYQDCAEPELVKFAIRSARVKDFQSMQSISSLNDLIKSNSIDRDSFQSLRKTQSKDFVKQDKGSWYNRLSALETRADKHASVIWKVYLPVIFFMYGFLLGTVFFQQDEALLIMAGFCVYSVASALFMFPVMQKYFLKALEVYKFEHADGAGRASDIPLQAFARFSTMAIIPVVICAVVLYLLLVNYEQWSITVLLQLIVVGMALNQTWISLLSALLCAVPSLAFRLSPILSSIAGFFSGFFIPLTQVPWLYRWFFYINPNYYGFSASANILLSNGDECTSGTELLECYATSGSYILRRFDFDNINPFMNVAVLLLMTLTYFLLAIFFNWAHHTTFFRNLKANFSSKINSTDEEDETMLFSEEAFNNAEETKLDLDSDSQNGNVLEEEAITIEEPTKPSPQIQQKWLRFAHDTLEMKHEKELPKQTSKKFLVKRLTSVCLDDEEHLVYSPFKKSSSKRSAGSQFFKLVNNLVDQKRAENATNPDQSPHKTSLKERQQQFDLSVRTTLEVVKEKAQELNSVCDTQDKQNRFRDVSKRVTEKLREERGIPKLLTVVEEASLSAATMKKPSTEKGLGGLNEEEANN